MAQYFTDDFSDFAADWTQRWDDPPGNTDWTVSAGTLSAEAASGDFCGSSVNDYDAATEHEVLAKVKVNTLSAYVPVVFIAGSGAAGSPSCYQLSLYTSRARIYYHNASETGVAVISPDGGSLTADSYYWVRFGIDASGDLYGAIWPDGGSEGSPWASWSGVTPAVALSGTWCGAVVSTPAAVVTWDQFGIGTNGDAAPSAAAGGVTLSLPTASVTGQTTATVGCTVTI